MSYRPGSTASRAYGTSAARPSSLPSRPPPPAAGYPPNSSSRSAYSTTPYTAASSGAYGNPTAYGAYGGYNSGYGNGQRNGYNSGYNTGYAGYSAADAYGASSAPKSFTNQDAIHAAEIALWNSAYTNPAKPVARNAGSSTTVASKTQTARAPIGPSFGSDADAETAKPDPTNQLTVVRKGGLQKWEDKTLLEWHENHPRLFIGNLAGEVTDDALLKAFSKYPSISKARVVRDKRTTKSKGFGFVSFAKGEEYFRAAKEMAGKYVGSHPITINKARSNVNPVSRAAADKALGDKKKTKTKKGESLRLEDLDLDPELTIDTLEAQYESYSKKKIGTPAKSPTSDTFAHQHMASAQTITAGHNYTPGITSKIAGRADTGAGVQKKTKKKSAKPKIQVLG